MTDEEILNEWCAVLERKHELQVTPSRYTELLQILREVRKDQLWLK